MTATPGPGQRPDAGERYAPDDARYRAVLDRQINKRFRASPEYVRAVRSTAEVIAAVDEAVRTGRRLVATSGGHCLEGFVSDPDARVIVDLSPMRRIAWDPRRRAVEVEAGATVGETVAALCERWGVVVPLGEYPGIGIGGHIAGGAFGFLCRQLGLAVDYLEAVEVVTVGADGSAAAVIASRDPADPNHDLWWAHTGGGAGNFGILTRCWFQSAGASGDQPPAVLPAAPARQLRRLVRAPRGRRFAIRVALDAAHRAAPAGRAHRAAWRQHGRRRGGTDRRVPQRDG